MESAFLFTVEDVFQLTERGCILTSGILTEPSTLKVKIGQQVVLHKPDGTSILTKIIGIAMWPSLPRREHLDILVSNITKEEVPPGTKVYLLPRDGTDSD